MKCLRCGYCCKNCMVVIVDDPGKGIDFDNLIVHEGNNESCPHLEGDTPGKFSCAVHNRPWYKKTPCFSHAQIEHSMNDVCRMGEYVLKNQDLVA